MSQKTAVETEYSPEEPLLDDTEESAADLTCNNYSCNFF
jgi:hypothetical protein